MSADQESPPGVRDLTQYGGRSPAGWEEIVAGKPASADWAYYEDAIRLPGFGRQPERCMARKPVGFCDTHGHVAIASASPCSTRGCPEHSHMWRKDAAERLVARLVAYRQAQPDGSRRRLLHVITSPDRSRRWTADAFWDARSASYDAVKAVGGRGGVTVPHAYRTSDEGDWLFEEAVERGDWDRDAGKWSLLRDAADDWGEMLEYVEEAPHFHHLVALEDFDTDAIPSGHVVKNIRSLDPFRLRVGRPVNAHRVGASPVRQTKHAFISNPDPSGPPSDLELAPSPVSGAAALLISVFSPPSCSVSRPAQQPTRTSSGTHHPASRHETPAQIN